MIGTNGDTAEALLAAGNRAWASGNRDQAMDFYRQLAQRFPDCADGYNKLGVGYAEQGQLDQAERYFLAAIDCDRRHAPALTNLGNIYLERGAPDDAIPYYALALESDPEYPSAHHNLAVAYRKKGELGVFVRHLKKSQRYERERDRKAVRADKSRGPWAQLTARLPDRWLWWGVGLVIILLALVRVVR